MIITWFLLPSPRFVLLPARGESTMYTRNTATSMFIKSIPPFDQQVAPVPSSGIEKLETDTFKLQSFQTLTGVKFVITAEAGTPDLGAVLHEIYELYTDYVLKVDGGLQGSWLSMALAPLPPLERSVRRRTHR